MPVKPVISKPKARKLVDEITDLNAEISKIQRVADDKKAALIKLVGTDVIALGTKTKANITHCEGRASPDDELKEKIVELVGNYLSPQYVNAHTKYGKDYDQVRIYDL